MSTYYQDEIEIEKHIEKLLCESSFYQFFLCAWRETNKGISLVDNWHIKYLCDIAQEAFENPIRQNLLINVPPKTLKSMIFSVCFPVWCWIKNQQKKFLTASFQQAIAERDCGYSRDLMCCDWFRGHWGTLFTLATDTRTYYRNDQGGHRYITTPRAALGTGMTADVVSVDDPNSADDRYSKVDREMVIRWWDETMPTRLNDWSKGMKIVIQQRIDVMDLTGHILENQKDLYKHISLPADLSEGHHAHPRELEKYYIDGLLSPIRLSRPILSEMQSILRTAYQGQILQSPIVSGGRIFKNQWVKWFTSAQLPVLQQIILSVDASFVDTPDACPASIQVWGKRGADYYLLYDETARMTAKSTLARIETIARMYQGCTVVVEKAANGYFIIQELQNKLSTYGFDPKKYGGKEVRAEMVAPLWENGNVYIADTIYNRTKYIVEILNFPNCEYVDRVDAMAQALLYFTRAQIIGGSFA